MKERPILFSVTTGEPSKIGQRFARLKRQGWPQDRYQLLCANCNFGKLMNGGVCPHQSKEARRA